MYLSMSPILSSECQYILNAGYVPDLWYKEGVTGPYWWGEPFADESCMPLVY